MRDISAITGMALGNIYYYYKTKDELFHDVLYPVVEQIQQLIDSHNTASKLNKCFFLRKNIITMLFYGTFHP